ncbi:ATP-binding protein [Pseudomonas chlororaphis]|uniref:histidine kinase n=1 Tax=Pseudomonas chlororaphis TaxID=587753 RepID=A0A1Q8EKP4_9PSED|nr:ATP-binding protein [Pseudomonas chlororaphis]OLF52373.1 hybrid sensor histidine kinase/response regulator [Pseudomonas chlororaphis]
MFKLIPYYSTALAMVFWAALFPAPSEAGQRLPATPELHACVGTTPCAEPAATLPGSDRQPDRGLLLLGGLGIPFLASLGWNAWLHRCRTRQRQAEQALRQQLELMQAWVDGLPHPAYVRDRQGLLLYCNASYLERLAVQREEIIGTSALQGLLDDPGQAREHHADYQQAMAQDRPLSLERTLLLNGQMLTVQHWVRPYRDASGEVQGVVAGWIDISAQHELADGLAAATQQAETASRSNSAFLASTRQQLRAPLNALTGLLELLLQRADGQPAERPLLEMAQRSAREIQTLLDAALDIALIESGQLQLLPEWLDPREQVDAIVGAFASQARQKQLKLLPTFRSSIEPADVLLDPLRFKQVLDNLLRNALRFTEQGQVRVHLELQPSTQARHLQLILQVTDSGLGIDPQDQQRLFTALPRARPLSGHGGANRLSICRHLCEQMQGTLQLTSQPGIGTEVRMVLQLACRPAQLPATRAERLVPQPGQALNVLVVEDHSASRMLFSEQLRFLGHRCRTANDSVQGLEIWRAGFFDLLIVDCNVPGMNGYDLTRAIRERERLESRAPCRVFGVTANADSQSRQQCAQAGLDECLFKPVGLASLGQKLAGLPALPWHGVFSLKALYSLCRGKPQFILRILSELLHCSYRDRQQLMDLRCDQAPQALAELAHKIKGSALMVQAKDLETQCQALEQASLQGADEHTLTLCRSTLEQAMLTLERALLWQLDQQDNAMPH